MKITVIHGQSHKGSTYHIARMLADRLGGDVTEFMLPRDFDSYCCGCVNCFEDETKCPHFARLSPITKAIDEADVLIFGSPTYVLHASGAMKNLLDHYGWRFMVHRPEEKMFTKQAVCISTAAGAGMKGAIKDMYDSLFFWGVARIYKYGAAVAATEWEGVQPAMKRKIERSMDKLADKIFENHGKAKPGMKTKGLFYAMRTLRVMTGTATCSEADMKHWKHKGWIDKQRPWKKVSE